MLRRLMNPAPLGVILVVSCFLPKLAIAMPQLLASLTRAQINEASTIFCQALTAGKPPLEARDSATEYLLEQVADPKQLNYQQVRKRMLPVVRRQCPEQARKAKDVL